MEHNDGVRGWRGVLGPLIEPILGPRMARSKHL